VSAIEDLPGRPPPLDDDPLDVRAAEVEAEVVAGRRAVVHVDQASLVTLV
jgi:hypothetical protein